MHHLWKEEPHLGTFLLQIQWSKNRGGRSCFRDRCRWFNRHQRKNQGNNNHAEKFYNQQHYARQPQQPFDNRNEQCQKRPGQQPSYYHHGNAQSSPHQAHFPGHMNPVPGSNTKNTGFQGGFIAKVKFRSTVAKVNEKKARTFWLIQVVNTISSTQKTFIHHLWKDWKARRLIHFRKINRRR